MDHFSIVKCCHASYVHGDIYYMKFNLYFKHTFASEKYGLKNIFRVFYLRYSHAIDTNIRHLSSNSNGPALLDHISLVHTSHVLSFVQC